MDNEWMGEILNEICREVKGQSGYWEADYLGRKMMIITDEQNNRMRIIAPISEQKKVKSKMLLEAMEANFDQVLDAKYALYNDVVWAVFVHPLGELAEEQFKDAMSQVFVAANTFGTSYRSTNLVFGGGDK